MAVISLVTVYVVLRPLLRVEEVVEYEGEPIAVYEDQLLDVDQDVERGVLSESEASDLKTEISRRLLDAPRKGHGHQTTNFSSGVRRRVAFGVAAAVIAGSTLLYAGLGSPHLPGVPASERAVERDYVENIERLAGIMAANPDDPKGWLLLATGYRSMGRFEDAVQAYEQAVTRGEPTAETLIDYGEIILLMSNGTVTEKSSELFEKAVAADPEDQRARYYAALSNMQRNKMDEALSEFIALRDSASPDAPWLQNVLSRISEIERLNQGVASASSQPDIKQNPDILAMVEGLAARLDDDPVDLPGWLRLIRSYVVLDEMELARQAQATARATFVGEADAIEKINTLSEELGLTTPN